MHSSWSQRRAKSATSATVEGRVWPVCAVHPEHGIVSGRNFRAAVAQHEGGPPVAVENLELFGRAGQGILQRGAAEADDGRVFVDRHARAPSTAEHRPIRNLHAALGQDIHARLVFIVFFLILNLFHHNTLRLSINILTF